MPRTRRVPAPPPVVFFHLPVLARRQAPRHGEAPAVGGACAMCYSIPIIPSLWEALGQREMLSCQSKHSPGHGCLTDGFSHLHKAFLRAPAPSVSQNSLIHVRNCCCHRLKSPRLKRSIFYPSCLLLSGGSLPAR